MKGSSEKATILDMHVLLCDHGYSVDGHHANPGAVKDRSWLISIRQDILFINNLMSLLKDAL